MRVPERCGPKVADVNLRKLRRIANLGNPDRARLFRSGRPKHACKPFARMPDPRPHVHSPRPLKPLEASVLDQLVLHTLPRARSVKIEKFQLREKRKKLQVLGARRSDRGAPEDRVVAIDQAGGFKQEGIVIRIGRAGVIEVRTVLHALARDQAAFNHEFRVGWRLQIHGGAPDELDGLTLQPACQIIFVAANGVRSGRRHHQRFAHSDGNRHLQWTALAFCGGEVPGQVASGRGAESRVSRPENLHPVDAEITGTGLRIPRDIHVPSSEITADFVVAPLRNRQAEEVDLRSLDNIFQYGDASTNTGWMGLATLLAASRSTSGRGIPGSRPSARLMADMLLNPLVKTRPVG